MAFVYRYRDNSDGIIKYIGIVWSENRTLQQRLYEHEKYDEWCKNGDFTIEYIEENINTRTDAEFFEAHYIALYKTDKYFNISKSGWGVSSYLPNRENDWKKYDKTHIPKNNDFIFRICWTKDESFDIKTMPVIKHICKNKKGIYDRHCRCGSNRLYKKDNRKCGQIYCMDCGDWVCQGSNDFDKFYAPEYIGEYEIKDGNIVETEYYTICFGRKDCWKTYTKDHLENVSSQLPIGVYTGRKNKLTNIHTYSISYNEIEEAKIRILNFLKEQKQNNISNIENEITDIKRKLKELPKQLNNSIDEYQLFLKKFEKMLA